VFLPLHDDNPIKHIRFQFVTVAVIVLCTTVYLYQVYLYGLGIYAGQGFVLTYGAIPGVIFGEAALTPELATLPAWTSLFTSAFLHGGWMHLISNMVFLWVLGDNVEDNLDHRRYIVFYVLCGLVAALTHAAIVMRRGDVPLLDRGYSKPAKTELVNRTQSRFSNSGKPQRRNTKCH
jgi:membrane associated rhomboid family serine protease